MAKYNLTKPCSNCPFRTDIRPYITAKRAREILTGNGEFPCHKTIKIGEPIIDCDEKDFSEEWCEVLDDSKAQFCAGVLICLEKEGKPNQIMRVAERLGLYDASKLKMDSPVYSSIAAAVRAHKNARR